MCHLFHVVFFLNNKHRKKVFLHLTVHTVHLDYFSFYIIKLSGDELVKGEQWSVHPVAMSRKKKTGCCRSE
ncbi:hypothetical protein DWG88_18260 [Escherichia coli]|nr:hypothetical protein [Escherichia coli]EFO1476496.1 hypothetical protein [Escherichia coli]